MKQFLFSILLLGCALITKAQDFQGVAYYESKTTMDMNFGGRENQMSEEQKKQIQERLKSMLEKTFVLTFNKTEASYLEEEKLETPGQGGFRMPGFSMAGKYYKNIKEKRYANQMEMFGKIFLIKDSLPQLQWQLGTETKKIGNYTCYKATAIKPIDSLDFRSMRPRRQRSENKQEGEKAKDTTKTRSLFDMVDIPKEVEIVAWYTPEIPVNNGPGEYWGLPGLILEVSADRTTILCSKIVINPKDKENINEPNKGKEVTQKEFNETMLKKVEEMRENFRAGGSRRRGGM